MGLAIEAIKERIKEKKLFKRNKIPVEIKILAGLLYYLGLLLRKTSSFLSQFGKISHESVRKYYHKLKEILDEPKKKVRSLIAIDETKLKVGNETIFVWSAIDVETKECLGVYVSESRNSLDTISFVRSTFSLPNKCPFHGCKASFFANLLFPSSISPMCLGIFSFGMSMFIKKDGE